VRDPRRALRHLLRANAEYELEQHRYALQERRRASSPKGYHRNLPLGDQYVRQPAWEFDPFTPLIEECSP